MEGSQAEQDTQGEQVEHVVQGRGPHDEVTRAEQQPQELGHSSAPPVEALSGVGATGIPANPGAQGGSDPAEGTGNATEGEGEGEGA